MKALENILEQPLAPHADRIYALLRITIGLTFAFHGVQKIFGVLTEHHPPIMSQIWIGGVIELVTGVLMSIGFLTRWSAFVASGTMAVAYIQFHWKFQFDENFFPAVNHGELALLYCLIFLYVAAKGAGAWGLETHKKA